MPGAANALADHQALRERPVIMAAMRIDRKNLGTGAHQQDILIADVPDQGLGREVAQFNAKCEIRPSGHGLLFSHSLASSVLPTVSTLGRNFISGYQVAMPR